MVHSSPPEFIVVAEAEADATIACALADRVFCEDEASPEWLDCDLLDSLRQWVGFEPELNPYRGIQFTEWKSLDALFNKPANRIPRLLRREHPDQRNQFDSPAASKAIRLALKLQIDRPSLQGLLLIRDMDKKDAKERHASLLQARKNAETEQMAVIVGIEVPKREAWVLNGFVCQTAAEKRRLTAEKEKLELDPCLEAHRLNDRQGKDRDIKRVLGVLTGGDQDRERECWEQTPLATLKANGKETGLANYLDEVRTRLLPRLSGPRP